MLKIFEKERKREHEYIVKTFGDWWGNLGGSEFNALGGTNHNTLLLILKTTTEGNLCWRMG